ncbi:hypothetical protein JX266_006077 [Neoarthrinium moseri]|nr:hypothetical protein JX266_006077 [Neoarthrinium moseri]
MAGHKKHHFSKDEKKHHRDGAAVNWGDWQWSDEYQSNFRLGYDSKGKVIDQRWSESTDTPRAAAAIDDELAGGMGEMSLGAEPGAGGSSVSSTSSWGSHYPSYSHDQHLKGKAKSHSRDEGSEMLPADATSAFDPVAYEDEDATASAYNTSAYADSYGLASDDGGDPEFEQALHASKQTYYGQTTAGESSSSASGGFDQQSSNYYGGAGQASSEYYPETGQASSDYYSGTGSSSNYLTAQEDDDYQDDGTHTPTQAGPSQISQHRAPLISGTSNYAFDDSEYNTSTSSHGTDRVKGSASNHQGYSFLVFKLVWAEPRGQSSKKFAGNSEAPFTEAGKKRVDGEMFYTGVRRFVVTASESGSSICVPILTYEGRGCNKPGVRAENHGIVYEPPSPPTRLRGEPQHGFDPVRMEIYVEGETLVAESRINYSKLVTIEHNINVLFIGRIYGEDFEAVSRAVDECWARRIRRPKKSNKKRR